VGVGCVVALLIFLLGIAVIVQMFDGRINLSKLVSEENGVASLSRFQFLIFTFVISMSLLLMVVAQIKTTGTLSFPNLNNVWALLGISGGSYVVSKGIQKNFEATQRPEAGASTDYIEGSHQGTVAANAVVQRRVSAAVETFAANLAGSTGHAGVAATAATTFSIRKNNQEFATMVFPVGSAAANFTGVQTTLNPRDVLTVVAPAQADATLADLAWTFTVTQPEQP